MSNRIANLVAQARAASSWELIKISDREAIRIVCADGTRLSFLTPDEVTAFRVAFDAAPEVWTVAGLPPCTWNPLREEAEGVDDALGLTVTIVGSREDLTPTIEARLGAAYLDLAARRDAINTQVATRVLALANKWRQNGPPLTIVDVAKRIRLTHVRLATETEHGPTLWFDDGDVFSGHSIEVLLDRGGQVSSATVAG